MSKVNWQVRLRSYPFWVAVFGLAGLIVMDLGLMSAGAFDQYVDAILLIMVTGGIITDPTTDGYKDSKQALGYVKPKKGD